jgi:hypothetical protein
VVWDGQWPKLVLVFLYWFLACSEKSEGRFLLSYMVYSQIWLNLLVDDSQITKLKKKTLMMIHWPSVCPFKTLTSAAHYCWQNLESDDSCFLGWCCPERRAAEKQCFGRLVVYLMQSPTSSFCLLILWQLWPSWRETAGWGDEEDTSCCKVWV